MTVGLFGGSFNPPHTAHLIVAEAIRTEFAFDQIWWMPGYQPPHKVGQDLAAAEHRLAMVHLATQDNPGFHVTDLEIRRQGVSYTVETLEALQATFPQHAFHLLLGGDSFAQFGTWYQPEEIVRRVPLIVYPRSGSVHSLPDPRFAARVRFAKAPLVDISSTAIRAHLKAGRSIRYLVPDAVRRYIEAEGLYLENR